MDIHLTFRDFAPSDAVRAHVERRAAKVLAHVDRVVAVRVVLARPHHSHQHGDAFRVTIDVVLPRHEIVVTPRDGAPSHADLHAAIEDAFDDLARQLHSVAEKSAAHS